MLVLGIAWVPAVVAWAQEPEPEPPAEVPAAAAEPVAAEESGVDETLEPCVPPHEQEAFWATRMRRGVFRTVCSAANWFDSFFGERRTLSSEDLEDGEDVLEGRLLMGLGYDEAEGFDPSLKLRARIPLPRMKNRWNALVGRTEIDDFTADRDQRFDRLPEALQKTDDEWLIGLGYNPLRTTRLRADVDAGVRVRFPLDPFVRARLRGVVLLDDEQLWRWRQTFFWRNAKGWGLTSAADYERILSDRLLARFAVSGTFAEETDGIEYVASYTVFQDLGSGRALAYRALAFGETDAPVAIEEYGFAVIHRRRFLRDWLFAEVSPGVGWRRLDREDSRELVWSVRFGLEMLFGGEQGR